MMISKLKSKSASKKTNLKIILIISKEETVFPPATSAPPATCNALCACANQTTNANATKVVMEWVKNSEEPLGDEN